MADTQAFEVAVQAVLDQAKVTAGTSGLSWNSFGYLYERLQIIAVEAAMQLALEGYQKKQLVLDAVGQFIDAYLPLPIWLFWLRPQIKKWIFWLADGAIESTYKRLVKLVPPNPPATL